MIHISLQGIKGSLSPHFYTVVESNQNDMIRTLWNEMIRYFCLFFITLQQLSYLRRVKDFFVVLLLIVADYDFKKLFLIVNSVCCYDGEIQTVQFKIWF